jgi:hypothetical protein
MTASAVNLTRRESKGGILSRRFLSNTEKRITIRQLVTLPALGILLASIACGGGGPTGTPDQSPDDLRGTWRVRLEARFTGTEIEFPCQSPGRGNFIEWSGTWVVTSASNPVQGPLDLEHGTGCTSPIHSTLTGQVGDEIVFENDLGGLIPTGTFSMDGVIGNPDLLRQAIETATGCDVIGEDLSLTGRVGHQGPDISIDFLDLGISVDSPYRSHVLLLDCREPTRRTLRIDLHGIHYSFE